MRIRSLAAAVALGCALSAPAFHQAQAQDDASGADTDPGTYNAQDTAAMIQAKAGSQLTQATQAATATSTGLKR